MQRGATRRGDIWPKLIVAPLRVLILFLSLHLNIHFSIGMSDSSVPYVFTPPDGECQARNSLVTMPIPWSWSQIMKIDCVPYTYVEISRNLDAESCGR